MRGKMTIFWGFGVIVLGMLWGITARANMYDDANGNIGLGTTAPAHKLEVLGASGVGIGTSAAGDALIVDSTGNVGIGSAAPGAKLEINGGIRINEDACFDAEYNNGNSGTAKTLSWRNGNKQKVVLTGNCTFTFSAPGGACNLVLKLVQDATGGRTVVWPAAVKWALAGTAPVLSTGANAIDIISFYYDGTNYYGVASVNFQ